MVHNISRRTWLRTVGLATAGLTLGGSGVAAATPGNGNRGSSVKNECPEGTTLLAKYEFDDDTGELVFEKGRESLNIDGSEITFSNIVTKDENEIISFDWDSGVYDIHTVSVKAGTNIWQDEVNATSGTFDLRDFDTEGPVQAVSNVIFCIEVCWQVDFGRGDIPEPPSYSRNDRPEDLLLAASCESPNPGVNRLARSENALPDGSPIFTVENEAFDLDTPGKASITFTIHGTEPQDLHFVSFETAGPFQDTLPELSAQVIFDEIELDGVAPGTYTWMVDLPTE